MRETKPFRESEHLTPVPKHGKASRRNRCTLEKGMGNDLKSLASEQPASAAQSEGMVAVPKSWVKVGAIAAASAVLGGLAAAWFYRKTLSRLREAEERTPDSEIVATVDDSPEDF